MNKKIQLALAIAQGGSVTAWASANGVCRRTAFNWAKDPLVRRTVESCRRRTIEHAIRQTIKQSTMAADGIGMLAKIANSESVKVEEFRTILADMTGRLSPRLEMTGGKKRGFINSSGCLP